MCDLNGWLSNFSFFTELLSSTLSDIQKNLTDAAEIYIEVRPSFDTQVGFAKHQESRLLLLLYSQ